MTERSWPLVGSTLSDYQWRLTNAGTANGIIDEWNNPYQLSLSSTSNTATIKPGTNGFARARVGGSFHEIDANVALTIPAVTSTTTYYIALCLNPANGAANPPTNPVTLVVYKGTPDTSLGQIYLVLYTVVRSASTTLDQSAVNSLRPTVSPLVRVYSNYDLQDPNSVLRSTIALVATTRQFLVADYDTTQSGSPKAWIPAAADQWQSFYIGAGVSQARTTVARQNQTDAQIAGSLVRSNGYNWQAKTTYYLGTLPAQLRPNHYVAVPVALTGARSTGWVSVKSTGEITLVVGDDDGDTVYLDSVRFPLDAP